jgi:hypothetical protein
MSELTNVGHIEGRVAYTEHVNMVLACSQTRRFLKRAKRYFPVYIPNAISICGLIIGYRGQQSNRVIFNISHLPRYPFIDNKNLLLEATHSLGLQEYDNYR